jgi:two-component system cell cycle sensor histidine kinase/response regulator CckA
MHTILVVDDEPGMRSLVRDTLELSGYSVLDAGDGDEALRLEEQYAEPIHLLLTDIVMPGLTGPQLAEKFIMRRPQARLLYMSAFSLVDITHHSIFIEPGVPILAKPFSIDGLVSKVGQLLAPSPFSQAPSPFSHPSAGRRGGSATPQGSGS